MGTELIRIRESFEHIIDFSLENSSSCCWNKKQTRNGIDIIFVASTPIDTLLVIRPFGLAQCVFDVQTKKENMLLFVNFHLKICSLNGPKSQSTNYQSNILNRSIQRICWHKKGKGKWDKEKDNNCNEDIQNSPNTINKRKMKKTKKKRGSSKRNTRLKTMKINKPCHWIVIKAYGKFYFCLFFAPALSHAFYVFGIILQPINNVRNLW